MARATRVDFPGAWHHVMNRGARREPIFREADDGRLLLDTLAESVERDGIEVHVYALMPNHFHLLVRSPHATLSRAMQRLGGRYTARLNERHGWDGPVFRGRFNSRLVTREAHLIWLLAYLHLNPVRAHLVGGAADAPWTSHRAYLGLDKRPPWLEVGELLTRLGGSSGVERFVHDVNVGRAQLPKDLEVSRWSSSPPAESRPASSSLRDPSSRPGVQEVLRAVQRIAGAGRRDLMVRAQGRGANPARRFATWALATGTSLTHAEVGRVLGMTPSQVHDVVRRTRRVRSEPVVTWKRRWREDGVSMGRKGAT